MEAVADQCEGVGCGAIDSGADISFAVETAEQKIREHTNAAVSWVTTQYGIGAVVRSGFVQVLLLLVK